MSNYNTETVTIRCTNCNGAIIMPSFPVTIGAPSGGNVTVTASVTVPHTCA